MTWMISGMQDEQESYSLMMRPEGDRVAAVPSERLRQTLAPSAPGQLRYSALMRT